jgi:hypothetical protein
MVRGTVVPIATTVKVSSGMGSTNMEIITVYGLDWSTSVYVMDTIDGTYQKIDTTNSEAARGAEVAAKMLYTSVYTTTIFLCGCPE